MMGYTHAPLGSIFALGTLSLLQQAVVPLPADGLQIALTAAACGMVGGLLPDIDQPSSLAANPGRTLRKVCHRLGLIRKGGLLDMLLWPLFTLINLPVRLIAEVMNAVFGHRGPIHSLSAGLTSSVLVGGVAVILNPAWWVVGLWLGSGYLSHLLADGLTITSQPLFWPLSLISWSDQRVGRQGGRKIRRTVRVHLLPAEVNLLPKPLRVGANGSFNLVLGFCAWAVLTAMLVIPYSSTGLQQLGDAS